MRATSCAPRRRAPAPPPGRSLTRIVIEGARLARLPRPVPEIVTPWRADAVLADRLRVGLDRLGELVGRDGGRKVRGGAGQLAAPFPFTRSSARVP